MTKDYLEILNLKPGNSLDDAKKSYRALSLKYHPDKNPSPDAPLMFRSISNAYEALKANPSLLVAKITPRAKQTSNFIVVEIPTDISDVYLWKTKNIKISRKRICAICSGTGSSIGHDSLCPLCEGARKIKNKVSSLIGLGDCCPACNGSGKKESPTCQSCRGSGYSDETCEVPFKISKEQYLNRSVLVKGVGNEVSPGVFGDLKVRLNPAPSPRLILDGDIFRFTYNITPAQYAIGDTTKISIYGKALSLFIPRASNEAMITDKREDGKTRYISVTLNVINKPLTAEVRDLYKRIIDLEKSSKD